MGGFLCILGDFVVFEVNLRILCEFGAICVILVEFCVFGLILVYLLCSILVDFGWILCDFV